MARRRGSEWNREGRIQGDTNVSELTFQGRQEARKCRNALSRRYFDACFSSPLTRARQTTEVVWGRREEPVVFADGLKEANVAGLQGLTHVEAEAKFGDLYRQWRDAPAEFAMDGARPIVDLWPEVRAVWAEILDNDYRDILVVSHKSVLRAMVLVALGLPPASFRSIDIHNAGISEVRINDEGEPMLVSLNQATHLYTKIHY